MKPKIILQLEKNLNAKFKQIFVTRVPRPQLNNFEYAIDENDDVIILIIRSTFLEDISFLKDLKKLTKLDLGFNRIYDISPIQNLKDLKDLNLWGNKISDISDLKRLKKITSLFLYQNQITNISAIENLIKLEELGLTGNPISDVSSLKNLKNLKLLYFDVNNKDFPVIKDLNKLEKIGINNSDLSDISILDKHRNLKYLNLSYNKIIDISPLQNLKNLNELLLSNNQISDISALKDLKNLETLDLRDNLIKILPKWICDFPKMKIYWKKLGMYDNSISLFNNPIENIPIELVTQGKEAIKNYFKQIEKEEPEYLFETKVLVIGEGGTGKTSFVTKIQDENKDLPKDDDTTLGIDVSKWSFNIEHPVRGKHTMYANLWDFGGQKLYQGTHQIFFSTKSFYVLLDDTREEKTDFAFWLNTVELLAGEDSKLLIVINKKHTHVPQIDENGLKARFGNLINDFYTVDLKNDKERIVLLQKKVKLMIEELPGIGDPLPASWVNIRNDLFELKDNYISYDRYYEICKKNKTDLSFVNLNSLSEYFNRIGVFTHYYNDSLLKNRVYLNSDWLLNTVYEVLNHEIVKGENHGRLCKKDLEQIWKNNEHYKELDILSALMHRFGLMYKVQNEDNYVVPAHLSAEQPYVAWEYENKNDILQFAYEFDKYMPRGIMPRIIVTLHKYIRQQKMIWNKGVNIEHEGTFAEIKETYDRTNKYLIRLYGKDKKDLLVRINHEFDKILEPYKKLKYEKLVPCICSECKGNKNPHFHKYSNLIKRKEKGKHTIDCDVSFEDVNVIELLDGVTAEKYLSSNLHEIKDLLNFIHEDLRKEIYDNLDATLNYIDIISDEIKDELKEKYNNLFEELNKSKNSAVKIKFAIPFIKLLDLTGIPVGTAIKQILNIIDIKFQYERKIK